MLSIEPGKIAQGQQGLSFANVLRDSLVCGIIVLDGHQRVASLSNEAARILGLESGQTLPQPLEILPAPLQQVAREGLSSGQPAATRQVEITASRGGPVTVSVSAVPLSAGRRNGGLVLVLQELSVARQLEGRIQQLDRLASLGTLAASMAHELRNALVAGKTFIDLLLERQQDAELAGVVRREIGRIEAIVGRMLNFAGPARAEFAAIGLHEVLEHSLQLVQPQLEDRGIELTRLFQAARDRVNGDDYELQQAFVNLLLNALDAMGSGGTLTVATEIIPAGGGPVQAPQLRVLIRDTGSGIAPEDLERLFEPFFTTKPDGTGLGLAITRRIVQEHQGAISVESRRGQGTTFEIALPLLERAGHS